MFASLGALVLGVVLGLRHAFEPDHLTAVSTLVVDGVDARGGRRGALLGALWGLGHTVSLVVVGTALLVAGVVLPERLAAGFELLVAGMLILLGARSILAAVRGGADGPVHTHRHGAVAHAHAAPARHLHLAGRALAWRPLVVGLVHGLAGSGAITAIVFAELPTLAARITYITLFGAGSIAGMALASAAAGASFHALAATTARRRALAIATGALSIALGIAWAIPQLALVA